MDIIREILISDNTKWNGQLNNYTQESNLHDCKSRDLDSLESFENDSFDGSFFGVSDWVDWGILAMEVQVLGHLKETSF